MDKKYLENQAAMLINSFNTKRFAEVVQKGKVLIKKFPNQLIFYNATALSLSSLGKNYEALGILKLALNLSPKDIFVLNNLGLINSNLNRNKEAKNNYEIVSKIDQSNTAADKSISTMHKYLDKDDPHLILMIKKLKKISDDENLKLLYFALGKAYEDIEDYKESFKYLRLGNNIADKQINYNTDDDKKLFLEIKRIFKSSYKDSTTNSKKKIIFILGMPRSGTTLVEQIISAHKKVYGGGELSYMEDTIKKVVGYNAEEGKTLFESFKNVKN